MWLSLMRTALSKSLRWLWAPPVRTGVALERPQAGRGLSRVGDDGRAPWGQRVDERASQRGHSAHALREIECRPFGREKRSRAAVHGPQSLPLLHALAVGLAYRSAASGIDPFEDAGEDRSATYDQIAAGYGDRPSSCLNIDGDLRRQIAARQIFGERAIDDFVQLSDGKHIPRLHQLGPRASGRASGCGHLSCFTSWM